MRFHHFRQRFRVDAGNRNGREETANEDETEGEKDSVPQFFDFPDIGESGHEINCELSITVRRLA